MMRERRATTFAAVMILLMPRHILTRQLLLTEAYFDLTLIRSHSDKSAATRLVQLGEGQIFFQHARKASGSTIRHFVKTVLSEKTNSSRNAMPFWVQEWGEFPVGCLREAPRTLFITCLRNPTQRLISEYWYAGLGASNFSKIDFTRKLDNETKTQRQRYANLPEKWRRWIDNGHARLRSTHANKKESIIRGAYVDNFYVRLFSGTCGHNEKSPPEEKNGIIPESPCSYFGHAYKGGCRLDHDRKVREADMDMAIKVLLNFNYVFITEHLNDARFHKYISVQFDLPFEPKFETIRPNANKPPVPPKEISELLLSDNFFDINLYTKLREDLVEKITRPTMETRELSTSRC